MASVTTGGMRGRMFDETSIRHAVNTKLQPRIILFADVERPLQTWAKRWADRAFAPS
jgi:aspartyl/asparaginyl beta-hydroxylase (cupin superfamily)